MSDLFGIGGIVGGLLGYKGVKDTNKANLDIANQATATNVAEAQRNRDFQASQSATAYQRAVADMESAGLNPMLAYQQGGASTASGSTASAVTSRNENPLKGLGEGVASATQLALTKASIANTEAMQDKNAAEASLSRAMVPGAAAQARLQVVTADQIERRMKELFPHEVDSLRYSSAHERIRAQEAAERFAIESGRATGYEGNRWLQERQERSIGLKLSGQEFDQRGATFPFHLKSAANQALVDEARGVVAQKDIDYNRNPWGGKYDNWIPDLGPISSSAVGAAAGARLGAARVPDWSLSRPARVGPIEPTLRREGSGMHDHVRGRGPRGSPSFKDVEPTYGSRSGMHPHVGR